MKFRGYWVRPLLEVTPQLLPYARAVWKFHYGNFNDRAQGGGMLPFKGIPLESPGRSNSQGVKATNSGPIVP